MVERRRRPRWTVDTGNLAEPVTGGAPPIRRLTPANLDVHYQPIVDMQDGSTFAHEALVRCKVEAFRNPVALLDQAIREQSLGRLGRTIRAVTFARATAGRVFVNLHPEELHSRWLIRPDDPMSLFEGDLYLEITESAALDYFDLCTSVLKEVCQRTGAKLVVDDFGAGYSNLQRVIDLEPQVVKLDRALIEGIEADRRRRTLVEQLVRTCHALGASVVAEGIETHDQLLAVRDTGANYAQGYLLARPDYPFPVVNWPLASGSM